MPKKLMILGASVLQLPAIKKAKAMGLEVVVCDMNPKAIGFKEKGIIKEVVSTTDIAGVVEAAERNKIDGIMTLATDMPMRAVAAVCKDMNLIGIDEDTALRATNKFEMRKALKKNGVPVPKFKRVSNREEYSRELEKFTGPVVVKPADSSGSRGVILLKNIKNKELNDKAYRYASRYSNGGDIILEDYMVGQEISVETLAIDGDVYVIQITDKVTTGSPYFVETGHSQPTKLDDKTKEQVVKVTKAANKAIGIVNGPSHTEIIVTKEGPKIVELGARLGGDYITTHLVPLSTGVDMVECCINIALGEKPDIEEKFKKGSAIRYFEQKPGIIKSIDGIEEAKKVPGVKKIDVVHGEGSHVTEIIDSNSRIGMVLAQGNNADDAIKICEKAKKKIKIKIK